LRVESEIERLEARGGHTQFSDTKPAA
jgi:hypothetical protein